MALQWQPVHVNFGEGVDTMADSKAVVATKLLKAQNVVFTSPGSLRTRYGWESAATYADARRLVKRGDELAICKDRELYPQNRLTKWLSGMAGIRRSAIMRKPDGFFYEADMAIIGNVAVTAGLGTHGSAGAADQIMVVVSHVDTGETIRTNSSAFATNATKPRCVAVGQYIWVLAINTPTTITGTRYNTVSGAFDASLLIGGTTLDGLDLCPVSATQWAMAFTDSGIGFVFSEVRDADGNLVTGGAVAAIAATGVAMVATENEGIYIAYKNDTSGNLEASGWSLPSHAAVFSASVLQAAPFPTTGPLPVRVTIGRYDAATLFVAWNDFPAVAPRSMLTVDMTSAGVVGLPTTYWRHTLQSKMWLHDGVLRLLVGYESDLQGTTYVQQVYPPNAPQIGSIVARQHGGCASFGLPDAGCMPSVVETETSGVFLAPAFVKQRILGSAVSSSFSYSAESIGIDHLTIDHVSAKRFCTAELGGLTYIAGGMVHCYDGSIVMECGFLQYPEVPTLSAVEGGSLELGTHQVVALWAYTDAQGNVHRSAPSVAAEVTIAGTVRTVSATVQPLNMSQRDIANIDGVQSQVYLEWYMTLQGSSAPFYRVHAPGQCTKNTAQQEPDLATADATDDDATLSQKPQLYTAGNALPNYPPPSTDCLFTHQNRLVAISAEDGRIWFSKEYIVGEAPGFNDVLTFSLPTNGFPVAGCSFDDKAIFWTDNGEIHVLGGDFPNDTGAASTLHSQRIASDVGGLDWRSVNVTHEGAFFASPKGLMLLTRGLQVVPAGYDVTYWTDNYTDVTSAIITPDRDEFRFTVRSPIDGVVEPTGQTLVLNFRGQTEASPYGQWSHFDDALGDTISSIVVAGQIYRLTDDGSVFVETTDYSDDGAWITVDVETANIYPFGRQAAASVRTATLLGRSEGTHAIEMQVAYDDDIAFIESSFFSAADLALLPREQVGIHLWQQKCCGVRLKITTYQDGDDPNQAVTLSGIVLEAAQKRGTADRRAPKEARQ